MSLASGMMIGNGEEADRFASIGPIFKVNNSSYFITVAHLFSPNNSKVYHPCRKFSWSTHIGDVIFKCEKYDFCCVKLNDTIQASQLNFVTNRSAGTTILKIGAMSGLTVGYLYEEHDDYLIVKSDGFAAGGDSGAAVFDSMGKSLGIILGAISANLFLILKIDPSSLYP